MADTEEPVLEFNKGKYKEPQTLLSKYLPWAVIAERGSGVVLQKDGVLQKTLAFRGPDLDAASASTVAALSYDVNMAVKRLGSKWAVFFEAQKYATTEYPGSKYDSNRIAAFLIDEERAHQFRQYGLHYETSYYLTLTYALPNENIGKAARVFYSEGGEETDAIEEIRKFQTVVRDFKGIMSHYLQVQELDDEETLSYIHSSLSMEWHRVRAPERMIFLDKILPDNIIEAGMVMKVGDYYAPIVGVNDFPTETYPGILDVLNKGTIEYRWVTRFICLNKEDALKEISKYQKKYYGARKSMKQLVSAAATKVDDGRINQGAVALEADANEAQIEVTEDSVGFGYYTTDIMVWDKDRKKAEEKASYVKQIVQQHGFVAKTETFNAFEAWLGMMPGNVYANMRRPLVSTGNLSHVVPLTAVWSGDKLNHFFNEAIGDGTPHMTCSTSFGTPFYLSLGVGDVMHTFIAGPSGAGKSVLLGALAAQFRRYDPSRVIIFDKDRSAKQLTIAMGGDYYEPGSGDIAFQPLARLNNEEDIIWASEFIELLMEMQSVSMTAEKRKEIMKAVQGMKEIPEERRTISSFQQYVQDPEVKSALTLYTLAGPYGTIFDADHNELREAKWLMIEMDPLMQLGKAAIMPALMYLFHEVDRMFDGTPTLLILDEAWLFLQHPIFQKQMQNWLKTLRKKRVGVVFATQEIADAAKSDIMATILQQCHTKIYLPDEEAPTQGMKGYYEDFGLTDGEIAAIARGRKKSDYFYKSSKGTRLFRLDLGEIALALITNPDHELLKKLDGDPAAALKILEGKGLGDKARQLLTENPSMDTRGGV